MQFEDMRILIEAVDRGSFSAAALRLGLSKQFVSRRIAALEARLGVPLLLRTTRSLSLTDAGRDYAGRVRRILADVDEADQVVRGAGETPRGTLRLSAPLSFGTMHLSPHLTGFMALHPQVTLDIDLTDRTVDLVADGYDMAIRIGQLDDSTLVVRKLCDLRFHIVASPDYLRRQGIPTSIRDLAGHRCLLYRHRQGTGWWVAEGGKTMSLPMAGIMQSTNGEVLRDAALAGHGLAQLPDFITGAALGSGALVSVLDDQMPPPAAAYAVWPGHRQSALTVRALADYLVMALGDASFDV